MTDDELTICVVQVPEELGMGSAGNDIVTLAPASLPTAAVVALVLVGRDHEHDNDREDIRPGTDGGVGPAAARPGTAGGYDSAAKYVQSKYYEKHPLLPPPEACSEGRCKKQCNSKAPMSVRRDINKGVTGLTWDTRVLWHQKHVHKNDATRRTKGDRDTQRQKSFVWHLPVDGELVSVCKGFFLTTVGLKRNNDEPIRTAQGMKSVQPVDKCGSKEAANRADSESIRKHIESYHPSAPHYR